MSKQDNGGPAFPVHPDAPMRTRSELAGMSLRDYFAAHCQAPSDISRTWGEAVVREFPKIDGRDMPLGRTVSEWWADVAAAWSYMQADAMLKARQK